MFLYAYVFPNLPIVNYYRSKAASEGSATVTADLAAGGIQVQLNSRVYKSRSICVKFVVFQPTEDSDRFLIKYCDFCRLKRIPNNKSA